MSEYNQCCLRVPFQKHDVRIFIFIFIHQSGDRSICQMVVVLTVEDMEGKGE